MPTHCHLCDGPTMNGANVQMTEGLDPMKTVNAPSGHRICRTCLKLPHRVAGEESYVRVVGRPESRRARDRPWDGKVVETHTDGHLSVINYDDDEGVEFVDMDKAWPIFPEEDQAAAYLAAAKLSTYGQTVHAQARGRVVRWFHTGDINLQNVGNAIDMDLGEVGDAADYAHLLDTHGEASLFCNFRVRGVRDPDTSGFGYGLPTHSPGKHGASLKSREDIEDIDPWLLRAARDAGLELDFD